MNFLISAISFIGLIGILVTAHEFGHFWVARKLGVRVLRFSIGFGRPLFTWRGKDKTEYVLAAIPLGGYVKMLDEREGDVKPEELSLTFNRKSLAVRSAIVSAGPIFNFILAIIAFWGMYMFGVEGLKPLIEQAEENSIAAKAGIRHGDEITTVSGSKTQSWDQVLLRVFEALSRDEQQLALTIKGEDFQSRDISLDIQHLDVNTGRGRILNDLGIRIVVIPAVVGEVLQHTAASRAGFKTNDRILKAGESVIDDWRDWVRYVQARAGQRIDVSVERAGQVQTLSLTPDTKQKDSKTYGYAGLGVKEIPEPPAELRTVIQYSPLAAAGHALTRTGQVSMLMLRMLYKMVVGEASIRNISGPITIAQFAGHSAVAGLAESLAFIALVSISLGVLNLLPIPVLDGGHLFYYLLEFIKGSPVSERVQLLGQQLGLIVLMMLITLAFYNDITRLL